jgi:hypothetical protein
MILLGALLVALPILATELGVRALIATSRLPAAPSHSIDVDASLLAVLRRPPQDVLILGDSQALTAFEPALIADALEAAMGRPVSVFNLGQAGFSPASTTLLVQLLDEAGRLPRVAILDVPAAVYREPGAMDEDGDILGVDGDVLGPSPLGREVTGCVAVTDLVERVDCELAAVSAAWRWSGRPERLVAAVVDPLRTDLGATNAALGDPGVDRAARRRPEDGFGGRRPGRVARIERRVDEFASRFTSPPRLVPERAAAFADLVTRLEAAGVTVILVGMPLTRLQEEALVARFPDWHAARAEAAAAFAAAVGRPLVDVPRYGDWWSDESIADANHVSVAGARAFTADLLARPDFVGPIVEALDGEPSAAHESSGVH